MGINSPEEQKAGVVGGILLPSSTTSTWLETTQQDSAWRHTVKGQGAFQLEVAERLRGEKSSHSGYADTGTHCPKRL